jgi:methyl-accepting chemotaxis protein
MKWFADMKISRKLMLGFLAMAAIAALVGAVGVAGLIGIKSADASLYKDNTLGVRYSGQAAVNFQQLRYNVLKLQTLSSDADIADTQKLVEEFRGKTDEYLNSYISVLEGNSAASEEAAALTDEIYANWTEYNAILPDYMDCFNSGDKAGVKENTAKLASIGSKMRDDFLVLMDTESEEAAEKAASNGKTALYSIALMLAVIAAAVAISLVLGAYISGLIGKPLVLIARLANMLSAGNLNIDSALTKKALELANRKDEIGKLTCAFKELIISTREQVAAAERVASGDLTVEVRPRSAEDVLGKALMNLVDSLSGMVTAIISASEQVAAGANSLSDSSMALSQGATEQASSVEELTASIEQISSQTNLNSQNADLANEYAVKAKTNAAEGNEQMKEMLKAMDDINVSSAGISKIIKVIDDIAFQTNILALNAAVEAARAGQHGLGFAVVAEEVRTLAAKSAIAASETTEMIENSIKKVEAGTRIANETAEALDRIVAEVDKAADLVASIATASREQAMALEQINQGVMQISQVVQTNAATSEESAAASEEVSGQAAQLKEIVNAFKIKEGASDSLNAYTIRERSSRSASREKPLPARRAVAVKPKITLDGSGFGKY